MSMIVNMLGIDHQTAIAADNASCGSDLGGDSTGCPILSAAIDSLYNGASVEIARATCRQYGIQYLIARVYDPVWKDRSGWVWTLLPVVSTPDFPCPRLQTLEMQCEASSRTSELQYLSYFALAKDLATLKHKTSHCHRCHKILWNAQKFS